MAVRANRETRVAISVETVLSATVRATRKPRIAISEVTEVSLADRAMPADELGNKSVTSVKGLLLALAKHYCIPANVCQRPSVLLLGWL